jgi:hypothetical protein
MALTTITRDFIVKSGLRVEGSNSVTTSTAGIGTLSVSGGAAVAGNIIVGSTASIYGATSIQNILNVSGDVTVNNGKAVITAASGNIYTQGNVGVQGTFNSTGTISLNNLFTVDGTTGNVFALGTGYFGSDVGVQGTFNSTGTISLKNLFTVDGTTGNVFAAGTGYFGSDVGVKGAFNSTGTFSVNTDKFTVEAATGNLVSKGTGYFAGAVGVQGAFNSTGTFSVNTNKFTVDSASGNTAAAGTLYVNGNAGFNGNVVATGTVIINSTQAVAQDGSAGALIVQGGAYVGDQLYVSNNATFGTDVYIQGALYVEGGQTVVDSTVITTGDKVIYVSTATTNAAAALGSGLAVGPVGNTHISFEYDGSLGNGGRPNFVSSGGLIADSFAASTTTVAANALVAANGGIGADGDSYINGNLAVSGVVFGTVTQANNLNGGGAKQIAYQSATGVTTFIAAPTVDNQVLSYTAADGLYWNSAGNTTVSTATNIAGGGTGYVPFQTAAGLTDFDSQLAYTSTGPGSYLTVPGLWVSTAYELPTSAGTSGQVLTTGGSGSQATWGDITLNLADGVSGTGSVDLNTTSLTIEAGSNISVSVSGSTFTIGNTYSYSPTDTLDDVTTRGSSTMNSITVGGLTDSALSVNGGLVYTNGSGTLADDANLTWNGTSLTVGGSGGDITMSGGNITGVNNVSAVSLTASDLTSSYVVFAGASGVLTDSSAFTYASSTLTAPNFVASSTTDTTGSSDGALVVDGGVYVAKRLFVDGGTGARILADGNGGGAVAIYGGLDVNNNIYMAGGVATNGGAETKPDLGSAGGAYIGKDLYVGTTATFAGDVFVDGTIFVKGSALTGIDQISGSTATFANLSVTNTATIANLTVTGNITLPSLTLINVTATNFTVTGNTSLQGTTATTLNVTGNATFNSPLTVTDTTDADNQGLGQGALQVTGGINARKNITAGGMLIGGDATIADSGTVPGLYIRNNVQAAGTFDSISGSAPVSIDSWNTTLYTSAKYIVQIVDSGSVYVSEIMIMQVGGNAYISEYGIVNNNGDLGNYSITQSGSNLVLKYTPDSASAMTIQVVRQSILTSLEANYC